MNLQDHADKVKDAPAKEEKLSKTKPAAVVEMQSSDEEDEPPQKRKKTSRSNCVIPICELCM